jgi:DNA modification methylase
MHRHRRSVYIVTGPQQQVIHGDCIEVMRGLAAESVHVVITDPPAGIGFMGKGWDSFADYQPATSRGCEVAVAFTNLLAPWARGFVVFMVDVWTEAMRVLKPGGHVCAWALPKTGDLAGLALRLAGFELRDGLVHLFGSGMPHGQDISKAIDKAAGAEREVVGKREYAGGHVQNSAADRSDGVYGIAGGTADARMVTAPATPEAEHWHDWNTQLAPGHEQWLLARKPSPLNYAATAVEHGTGALNIGACRVPRGSSPSAERRASAQRSGNVPNVGRDREGQGKWERRGDPSKYCEPRVSDHLGGYPSNVLLSHSPGCGERCVDGCPVLELDRQSGQLQSGSGTVTRSGAKAATFGKMSSVEQHLHGDTGGASRYFPTFRYQAKAKRRDIPGRPDLTIDHPTHKHPDLMRWLVRLLASPGAHVLDPFGGSGTTGVACAAEGFDCTLIELNPASVEQARARIAAVTGDIEAAANSRDLAPTGSQLSML